MNTDDAYRMGTKLMAQHLDSKLGWTLRYDNAKSRFGACHYGPRRITLSRALVALNSEEEVRNTILHEIAHAMAGHAAGHGPEWKRIAASIGCDAKRLYDSSRVVQPERRYLAVCPACSKRFTRSRAATRATWCPCEGRRFDYSRKLVWQDTQAYGYKAPTATPTPTPVPVAALKPVPATVPDGPLAGLPMASQPKVVWRGTNRETKTVIVVTDARPQGWTTYCEEHRLQARHATRGVAMHIAGHPTQWCDGCRALIDPLA